MQPCEYPCKGISVDSSIDDACCKGQVNGPVKPILPEQGTDSPLITLLPPSDLLLQVTL